MDLEKNNINIENEDGIFNIDETNLNQQGNETFSAEEEFKALENNIDGFEENDVVSSKAKVNKEDEKNINPSHLSSAFFGVVASVVSTVLIIGTAVGIIPSIISLHVNNFLSRSTVLGFEVEKDPNKEYSMSLYNDDYEKSLELNDNNEYVFSELIPNTKYNLVIYEINDGGSKEVYSANYLTKGEDEFNASVEFKELQDSYLDFNIDYEGSGIDFVTVEILENNKQLFLYEGSPKNEFSVMVDDVNSDFNCKVYINGVMTEFKQFIESGVVPTDDENPGDDETPGDDTEKNSVESVSLSESEITLVIGETKAITATVLPENATNKALRWSISGTDVATVEDGLVTAVGVGRTILVVSSNDGGKYKTCVINVTDGSVPIQSISLNESTINMEIGESETLEATVLPENASDKSVTWTSEDPTIATVEDGLVTAVAEGHTTIIATGSDGITWAGCSVYVTDPTPSVKSVSLNESTLEIGLGENSTLTATVIPYNAVDTSVIWESSDKDVATVANGVITAVGVGETTIKVTTVDGGFKATCIVTVVDNSIHVTGVSFENDTESVEQNKTITLVPIIAPTNATNTNVTWESSDTDVATVNSNGVVTGVMPGEATITVTTEDGSFTATCDITVTAIEPTFSNFFIESNKTNSGNEIITFILGYEDPSLVWKNKFIVECLRKEDSEILFKDYVTPSSSKYAALNSKNRYMLLEWKDSYLEALSDPEGITYTINVYAESDEATVIYTRNIYSGNGFSTGMNPIPGSIILDSNVNDSGQVKPRFHISSTELSSAGLSGIDRIGVIFSYPATGEGVATIQDITLDEIITVDINLPSGSTPYNVTVFGYIDSEDVTIISEKITISNN